MTPSSFGTIAAMFTTSCEPSTLLSRRGLRVRALGCGSAAMGTTAAGGQTCGCPAAPRIPRAAREAGTNAAAAPPPSRAPEGRAGPAAGGGARGDGGRRRRRLAAPPGDGSACAGWETGALKCAQVEVAVSARLGCTREFAVKGSAGKQGFSYDGSRNSPSEFVPKGNATGL